MMGRQSGQMNMVILDLSELIPENHFLRKINRKRFIIARIANSQLL